MHLTDQEFDVLAALARLHNDHGEYIAADTLAGTVSGSDRRVVANVLHGLSDKQCVEFDDQDRVTITEAGAAALKAI
ncbi:hypothetical protein [Amorphus orientalis]|uniref:Mn-dependent DtxR family transcriptional regulator n=1 Tax=Amorphus orientalis TaxID=649198 RepID=A0AAE4AUT6_9HYPH|nr:hypothetical protein [Amorphus orientalis]MDQ0317803.1 Mn-dependent DtxR family transcriptional regulator [Amorphus orientalis]